jgi:hypothetical protein
VPLFPPQIPYGLTQARTQASAVRGRRLTTWAMARPSFRYLMTYDYKLEDQGLIPARHRIFSLVSVSRPALRPTLPPIQWVLGVLFRSKARRDVTLTTHPIYCLGQEWIGALALLPLSACMAVAGWLLWRWFSERGVAACLHNTISACTKRNVGKVTEHFLQD